MPNTGRLQQNEAYQSVLFWLEPKNSPASAALQDRGRVRSVITKYSGEKDMLEIQLLERKNDSHGLIAFGRHPRCGIWIEDKGVSLEHCYIDINPSSGELLLCHMSQRSTTWLDNERVENPPKRALVFNHAKIVTIGTTIFKIHWPPVPEGKMHEFRKSKIARAAGLLADPDYFDLTDLEWDIYTAPPTQPLTRLPSVASTPSREPLLGPGPIEIAELGSGAFGRVNVAVDRINGDFVAVKLVRKRETYPPVEREIDILCKLDHVNIVRMIGWRDNPGSIQIDLQFCSRGCLRSIRDEIKHCLRPLFLQTATGLDYLHRNNVIHRDIKPENILVHQSGPEEELCFKLADFGLSNDAAEAQTQCGTMMYAAPEIVLHEKQTFKLDIYSLGVVILEILGCFGEIRALARRGQFLFALIIEKAATFRFGDEDTGFLRKMIKRNRHHRPTAGQCLKYLRDGVDPDMTGMDNDSREEAHKLATQGNKSPNKANLGESQKQQIGVLLARRERDLQLRRAKLSAGNRRIIKSQKDRHENVMENKPDSRIGIKALSHHPANRICNREPSAARLAQGVLHLPGPSNTQQDNLPAVLRKQKCTTRSRVLKRRAAKRTSRAVLNIPGAWPDSDII